MQLAIAGCGTIAEIPVEPGTGSSGGSGTGHATAGEVDEHGSTDPDQDTMSGGEDADGSDSDGSTGGEPPVADPYCSSGPGELRRDEQWLELAVDVPPGVEGNSITVATRIGHPSVAELELEVRNPSGASATLAVQPPCDGAGLEVVFDDTAEVAIGEQCNDAPPVLAGPMRPMQALTPLLSEGAAGTWVVRLRSTNPENPAEIESGCVAIGLGG